MLQQLNETLIVKGRILESDRQKLPKGVLCRGEWPICNLNQLNQNNRMYEKSVFDKAIFQNKSILEKMQNRTLFGHAEHPDKTSSDLQLTSHVITNTFVKEDNGKDVVYQAIDVLDTPCGRIVNTLLEADCAVGVSTRAEGDLEECEDKSTGNKYQRVLPESYRYVTTDFTADPSTYGTKPMNVVREIKSELQSGKLTKNEKVFATALLEAIEKVDEKKEKQRRKKPSLTEKHWKMQLDLPIQKFLDGEGYSGEITGDDVQKAANLVKSALNKFKDKYSEDAFASDLENIIDEFDMVGTDESQFDNALEMLYDLSDDNDIWINMTESVSEASEGRYKSDKDIAAEFANFKITSIEVSPKKGGQEFTSGFINIDFPEAGEHVGGGTDSVSDRWIQYNLNGKIAFDNWYPESVYWELVRAIEDKIGAKNSSDVTEKKNRKIDLLIDGKYYATTTQSSTQKEAIDKLKARALEKNEKGDYKYSTYSDVRKAIEDGKKITAVFNEGIVPEYDDTEETLVKKLMEKESVLTVDRWKAFMKERWPEKSLEEPYAQEWLLRFNTGQEWNRSDYAGRAILKKLFPDYYPDNKDAVMESTIEKFIKDELIKAGVLAECSDKDGKKFIGKINKVDLKEHTVSIAMDGGAFVTVSGPAPVSISPEGMILIPNMTQNMVSQCPADAPCAEAEPIAETPPVEDDEVPEEPTEDTEPTEDELAQEPVKDESEGGFIPDEEKEEDELGESKKTNEMKSFDYEAMVFEDDVYCKEHLTPEQRKQAIPIFADSEWDYYPTCTQCGVKFDYVSLTDEGRKQEGLEEAKKVNEGKLKAYDVFLNDEEIDTVFDESDDAEDVKKSLIDHDGYDPAIEVKASKEKPKLYKHTDEDGKEMNVTIPESKLVFESYDEMVDYLKNAFTKFTPEKQVKLTTIFPSSVLNEKVHSDNTLKEMRLLKLKEASARAEVEKAIEMLEDAEKQAQSIKEASRIEVKVMSEKLKEAQTKDSKEVDSLRKLVECKMKTLKDLQKELTEAKASLADTKKLYEDKVNKLEKEFQKKMIKEYVDFKVKHTAIKLPSNSRALLENCSSIKEVDSVFEDVRSALRREALLPESTKGASIQVHNVIPVDPEQRKISETIGNVMNGM